MFKNLFTQKKQKSSSKRVNVEKLGEVTLKKHKQARYLKIRVEEQGAVSVTMPYFVRYEAAIDFIKEKIDWVQNEQRKFALISPPITEFKTKFRELELIPCEVTKPGFRLSPMKIKVYCPLPVILSERSERKDLLAINYLLKHFWNKSYDITCRHAVFCKLR